MSSPNQKTISFHLNTLTINGHNPKMNKSFLKRPVFLHSPTTDAWFSTYIQLAKNTDDKLNVQIWQSICPTGSRPNMY